MLSTLLAKLFSTDYMVEPDLIRGRLPSTSEAYVRCFSLAWPSALEQLLVAVMGAIGTAMVGGIGPEAISAVGITTQPRFLLMALVISLNVGVTAIIARRKGEGDMQAARNVLKQALLYSVAISAVMSAIGIIFARGLMVFSGANESYLGYATDYFKILMFGQFFGSVGLTLTSAQRGVGNTKISLYANVASILINVLFNYLLVNGIWIFPQLGVRGSAIATTLGNLFLFSVALFSVLRHDLEFTINDGQKVSFDKRTINGMVMVGSSALVEQLILRAGLFFYTIMCADLGTVPFATHQICSQIVNLSFSFANGFSAAGTSLVGFSLGEQRPDISMIYGKICQRYSLIIGIIMTLLFIVFRGSFIGIFSRDPEIIELGSQIMYVIASVSLVMNSQVVMAGCLRGAGDSKFVAWSALISMVVCRVALSYFLCITVGWGLFGAWLGFFADQLCRLVLNQVRFTKGKWTSISL